MSDDDRIPLFPLGTVLFPGATIALQIFEPRYVDMVSERLKREAPFGVCLIREGREVGQAAVPHAVGTLAWIADWERLPNGLLGLSVRGGARFRVRSRTVQPDELTVAEIERLPDDPPQPVPPRHAELREVPARLREGLGLSAPGAEAADDAGALAWRLAELLPVAPAVRQRLLEIDDPETRLDAVAAVIAELARSARG